MLCGRQSFLCTPHNNKVLIQSLASGRTFHFVVPWFNSLHHSVWFFLVWTRTDGRIGFSHCVWVCQLKLVAISLYFKLKKWWRYDIKMALISWCYFWWNWVTCAVTGNTKSVEYNYLAMEASKLRLGSSFSTFISSSLVSLWYLLVYLFYCIWVYALCWIFYSTWMFN